MILTLRQVLESRPDWRRQRACAGCFEVFVGPERDVKRAKTICAACPVRRLCLAEALVNEESYEIWGGLSFEERAHYCPVCGNDKVPEELGCTPAHSLIRLVRLCELERSDRADISVSNRQRPSARTNEDCVIPLGRSHSTARAYKEGCMCAPARRALQDERLRRKSA